MENSETKKWVDLVDSEEDLEPNVDEDIEDDGDNGQFHSEGVTHYNKRQYGYQNNYGGRRGNRRSGGRNYRNDRNDQGQERSYRAFDQEAFKEKVFEEFDQNKEVTINLFDLWNKLNEEDIKEYFGKDVNLNFTEFREDQRGNILADLHFKNLENLQNFLNIGTGKIGRSRRFFKWRISKISGRKRRGGYGGGQQQNNRNRYQRNNYRYNRYQNRNNRYNRDRGDGGDRGERDQGGYHDQGRNRRGYRRKRQRQNKQYDDEDYQDYNDKGDYKKTYGDYEQLYQQYQNKKETHQSAYQKNEDNVVYIPKSTDHSKQLMKPTVIQIAKEEEKQDQKHQDQQNQLNQLTPSQQSKTISTEEQESQNPQNQKKTFTKKYGENFETDQVTQNLSRYDTLQSGKEFNEHEGGYKTHQQYQQRGYNDSYGRSRGGYKGHRQNRGGYDNRSRGYDNRGGGYGGDRRGGGGYGGGQRRGNRNYGRNNRQGGNYRQQGRNQNNFNPYIYSHWITYFLLDIKMMKKSLWEERRFSSVRNPQGDSLIGILQRISHRINKNSRIFIRNGKFLFLIILNFQKDQIWYQYSNLIFFKKACDNKC